VREAHAYEILAGQLREQIAAGEWRAGDRLPSENSLAKMGGVSRSTVRESLRMLQQAGLIERTSPKVMVVRRGLRHPSSPHVGEAARHHDVTFADLLEALHTLEPELTRLAAERADDGDIRTLQEILAAQKRNLGRFAEWNNLDQRFHTAIAEMTGNPALIQARIPLTALVMPALGRLMNSREQTAYGTRYHQRILFEIESRDPDLAAAMTRRHVNDFRVAWEKAGLDFAMKIADLPQPSGGS
jgi:DNA-binding FadR family transcriptional regulator